MITNFQKWRNQIAIEGLSPRTIAYYKSTIQVALSAVKKHIKQITTDGIRMFLAEYPSKNGVGMVTMNNIRRNVSSFFSWFEDEALIVKSPMRSIKKIKTRITVKKAYTDEMLERMRNSCESRHELGERVGIHVHPHKFRRTMATMAIDKGIPIEQVQFLLGYQSINTTLKYTMIGQANVKILHRKFFG